jgi:predicted patatin/cPLA2 family phospholipase
MTPAEAREFGALVTALRPREKRGERRVALIHEGGGMRAAFGAGVFSGFLDEGLHADAFDGIFGVSAGALNTMYWIAENRGGPQVYAEDILEREHTPFFLFGGPLDLAYRLARGRPAIDLRAVAHIMEVARPFDVSRVKNFATPVWFPVMHARELKTEFIDARSLPESMLVPMLVAASSVPALADAFEIEQSAFIDGACGAPLPIDEAIRRGFNDLVVVLNLPEHLDPTWYEPFVLRLLAARRGLSPELPRIVRQARRTRRAALYALRHMPGDVRVTIIAPPEEPGRVLEREVEVVRRAIRFGEERAREAVRRARELASPGAASEPSGS